MAQLTQRMFGFAFETASSYQPGIKLFGIECGQDRHSDRLVHNAGWYNGDGEKLGWGDLTNTDMQKIAGGLEMGQLFVVLREQEADSNFKFRQPNRYTPPDVERPGRKYIADHCAFVVMQGRIYYVDCKPIVPTKIEIYFLTRQEAIRLINTD